MLDWLLYTGGELMKYIYKKQKLDENETRKFMRQIVSSVDHLHKAGIIHRYASIAIIIIIAGKDRSLLNFVLTDPLHSPK